MLLSFLITFLGLVPNAIAVDECDMHERLAVITGQSEHHWKDIQKFVDLKSSSPVAHRPFAGTEVYHLIHSESLKGFPEIEKDAKAVVVIFGGSGAEKGSARAFMRDAASLKPYGVSAVTFDYPFSGLGPHDWKYSSAREFKAMAFEIVKHYRKSNLPIYLYGHSYGATFIKELIYDSPQLVNGAILVSPGGNISKKILEHSQQIIDDGTLKKSLQDQGKDFYEIGEKWAEGPRKDAGVTAQYKSNKTTIQPTKMPVLLISGTNDIYTTPQDILDLGKEFKNAKVELWKNETHTSLINSRGKQDKKLIESITEMISVQSKISLPKREIVEKTGDRIAYYAKESPLFQKFLKTSSFRLKSAISDERKGVLLLKEFNDYLNREIVSQSKVRLSFYKESEIKSSETLSKIKSILSQPFEKLTQNDLEYMVKNF